ncbi:MAG: hypothetical protein ACJ74H_13180 [Thermoanaerobaculia bacterium]
MRTILNAVTALFAAIIAIWLIAYFTAASAMERAVHEPWPMNLGTLAALDQRVRPQAMNDAARQLIVVAAPLDIRFEKSAKSPSDPVRTAIGEYVKAEHVRAEATIGEVPHDIAEYLIAREAKIDALRDHLLRAPAIQWEIDGAKGLDAPIPNLLAHMHIARLLTTRALYLARENDVRAWDDLHAVWRLAHSLEARPELISQLIYLHLSRSVNGIAWKLPQPAPVWFGEVQKVDHRRLMLAAAQYDSWMVSRHTERSMEGLLPLIARPYYRWSTVNVMQHARLSAQQLAAMTACRFDGTAYSRNQLESIPRWNIIALIATPNIGAAWQRVFRATAEREATANAMRVLQGQSIVVTSACSDGAWKYDGTRLSFSRDLPRSSPSENAMPLSLAIPARATRRST